MVSCALPSLLVFLSPNIFSDDRPSLLPGNSSQKFAPPTDGRPPQRLNEIWPPSTDLAILNERIAILQKSFLEFEAGGGHSCRYDTEEAEWILGRNNDMIEEGIRDAGQELEGEMISKLEGWVQEDVDTKGEEIRQEIDEQVSLEVQEQVEKQTGKALANISAAIVAEVRRKWDRDRDTTQEQRRRRLLEDQDHQLLTTRDEEVVRQVVKEEVKEAITQTMLGAGGMVTQIVTEVTTRMMSAQLGLGGQNSTKTKQLDDAFELAVGDILDKFAHETTTDEMLRVFHVLQTKPNSAALYNVCGAKEQVELQRGLVEEWKKPGGS
ncbi:hypothetical protein B0T20DRAFT_97135 [Sordaria brevicollis]|uniref:Uncharacterized protein n=1 Tax=Sordaria brevicollis TaxID=83679 RepID=A0AAE0U2T2_SORBR|nr:hypothetical protein B0T20DRAFT_97135 [Sordaria brevicollis]